VTLQLFSLSIACCFIEDLSMFMQINLHYYGICLKCVTFVCAYASSRAHLNGCVDDVFLMLCQMFSRCCRKMSSCSVKIE